MAAKRNIPLGDISSNPILRAAYEEALKKEPIQSDFKKAASETDTTTLKAIKDLSQTVKTDKKSEVYLRRIDLNTQKLINNNKIINDTLVGILNEIQKLTAQERKEDKNTEAALSEIAELLRDQKDAEKTDKEGGILKDLFSSFKGLSSILQMVTSNFGKFATSVELGAIGGIAINKSIKGFMDSEQGKQWQQMRREHTIAQGITQENFPEATEVIRKYFGTGIPKMLGGRSQEEWEQAHQIRPHSEIMRGKAEVSQSVKESQEKSKEIMSQRQQQGAPPAAGGEKGWFDKFKSFMGFGAAGAGGAISPGSMPSGPVSNVNVTGNGQEAMSFFMSKGWSKEQAAAIVGNLMVESGNFSSSVLSGKTRGDGGIAVGVAQWHPDRQRVFEKQFGKSLIGASFKEQLEFVNWELNNTHKKAGDLLRQQTDARQAAAIVDKYYEASAGLHTPQRMANAAALMKAEVKSPEAAKATATPSSGAATPTTTPSAATEAVATPSAGASPQSSVLPGTPTVPSIGMMGQTTGQQQGTFGAAVPEGKPAAFVPNLAEKGNLPSNDIVALGKALQAQGISVSEHPSFGGVKMGGHAKNSAHYRGEAIDINGPPGIVEANDPVWGKKFDALAAQLKSAGYKVIWRAKGHYNHLHAQLGGSSSGHETTPSSTAGAGTTPSAEPVSPTTGASSFAEMNQAFMSKFGTAEDAIKAMTGGADINSMFSQFLGGSAEGGMGGLLQSMLGSIGGLLGSGFGGDQNMLAAASPVMANAPLPPPRPADLNNLIKNTTQKNVQPMPPMPPRRPPTSTPSPPPAPAFAQSSYNKTNNEADNVIGGGGQQPSASVMPSWLGELPGDRIFNSAYSGKKGHSSHH